MSFVVADRVKETSTTTGTGALTLAGARTGFRAFSSVCAVNDLCFYAIQAVDAGGAPTGEWECGTGTYSGANTLTRTTVLSSSNAGAAVSFAAGTKEVYITMPAVQVAWAREKLTANRTYYVRTDGSDSNTGLADTAGGAFLTIQKAIDVVADKLDIGVYDVTIQVADGTYAGAVTVTGPWVGSGMVYIQGNASTPANVLLSTGAADSVTATKGGRVYLKNFKLTNTGNFLLLAGPASSILFDNLNFGSCGAQQVRSSDGGNIEARGNYTISGGGTAHWALAGPGIVRVQSRTITLTGTPAFSAAFAYLNILSGIIVNGNTFSGSATGKRYDVAANSVLFVNGAATTYLPGDVAGTTATGGQYV